MSETKTQQKTSEAGDLFLATLSKRARAAIQNINGHPLARRPASETIDDDEVTEFKAFSKTLTPSARKALLPKQTPVPQHEIDAERLARYGVVESTEGEWAQLRLFKNADGLVRRLQQLEGQDVIVWCFYGVPLPITKGPQRYLELPGGKRLMQIPMFEGGPAGLFSLSDETEVPGLKSVEEAGFLGPVELSKTPAKTSKATATGGGDDEDDED